MLQAGAEADAAAAALSAEQAAHRLVAKQLQEAQASLQHARDEAAEARHSRAAEVQDVRDTAAAANKAADGLQAANLSLQQSLEALQGKWLKWYQTSQRAYRVAKDLTKSVQDVELAAYARHAQGLICRGWHSLALLILAFS